MATFTFMRKRSKSGNNRYFRFLPLVVCLLLVNCITPQEPYKAYEGEERSRSQLALLVGEIFLRQDWINRYIDKIRFLSVDGRDIDNSLRFDEILITPGRHDIRVYFSWDTGSQRGLAPALVEYSSTRTTVSRTLSFNARAGRRYHVRGDPVYVADQERDITTLAYVDFWIEDENGNTVVSREEGRYVPDS